MKMFNYHSGHADSQHWRRKLHTHIQGATFVYLCLCLKTGSSWSSHVEGFCSSVWAGCVEGKHEILVCQWLASYCSLIEVSWYHNPTHHIVVDLFGCGMTGWMKLILAHLEPTPVHCGQLCSFCRPIQSLYCICICLDPPSQYQTIEETPFPLLSVFLPPPFSPCKVRHSICREYVYYPLVFSVSFHFVSSIINDWLGVTVAM